jgi:hypothetical protein
VFVIAHLGKLPVEETLPFLVPVVVLALWARREDRKRRAALVRVADAGTRLDEAVVGRIVAAWAKAGHGELSREHVALLSPPALEGASTAQLAARTHSNSAAVEPLLDDLADLGYVDFDDAEGRDRGAWLTADGYAVLHVAEDAILAAQDEDAAQQDRIGG